jgi:hypothetical protein
VPDRDTRPIACASCSPCVQFALPPTARETVVVSVVRERGSREPRVSSIAVAKDYDAAEFSPSSLLFIVLDPMALRSDRRRDPAVQLCGRGSLWSLGRAYEAFLGCRGLGNLGLY